MSMLSDFFIAGGSTVPDYQGGVDFDAADKCQFNGLSPLQGGQFLAVLRGQEYDIDLVSEFKLVSPEEAEDWTMTVPQDMVDKLAAIPDVDAGVIAAQFAGATREELGWSADDFVPFVTEMAALARRAVASGKSMYLWVCL